MATVYILHSNQLRKFYIGSCENLDNRLIQHRAKSFKNSFTSLAEDWEVFYQISDLNYDQARKIEMHIKKMKLKNYIENIKRFPEIMEKLIAKYSADSSR